MCLIPSIPDKIFPYWSEPPICIWIPCCWYSSHQSQHCIRGYANSAKDMPSPLSRRVLTLENASQLPLPLLLNRGLPRGTYLLIPPQHWTDADSRSKISHNIQQGFLVPPEIIIHKPSPPRPFIFIPSLVYIVLSTHPKLLELHMHLSHVSLTDGWAHDIACGCSARGIPNSGS
jgi:hypothetical protein